MRLKAIVAVSLASLAVSVPLASAGVSYPPPREAQLCPRKGSTWDSLSLVGKRLVRARQIAARHGCSIRVLRIDGVDLAGTDDYLTNRINVAIRGEKRRVVRILGIG